MADDHPPNPAVEQHLGRDQFAPGTEVVQLRAAIHQCDPRAVTPQVQSRDGGGIFATDHQHIGVVVGMGLGIIVRDLGQFFARKAQLVGHVVVSGGDDHLARAVVVWPAGSVSGRDAEVSVLAHYRLDPLVLANVELVVLGDLAVVLESFFARGFLMRSGEGDLADFE